MYKRKLFQTISFKKTIKIADEQNDLDKLILKIAFIFDLNFECSKKIIKEEKYIERILNRFEFKNEKAINQIREIKTIIKNFQCMDENDRETI